MFGLSPAEILLVLVVVVFVFGASRIPELGSALGQGIRNFKKSYRDAKVIDVSPSSSAPADNHESHSEKKA